MKTSLIITTFVVACFSNRMYAQSSTAQTKDSQKSVKANKLYLDVHHFGPGKVKYEDVEKAHAKDLAVQSKHNVHLFKYWVDEANGNVYCLASAPDSMALRDTHAEAHGLLPQQIYQVNSGPESPVVNGGDYFLDIHHLGAGKVTAKDVAAAHQKDLAVEKKYGVNFINYWVNEKDGVVVCVSQAPDSSAIIQAHKEAHGLVPDYIQKVKQGE
jgi:hypothetical protein